MNTGTPTQQQQNQLDDEWVWIVPETKAEGNKSRGKWGKENKNNNVIFMSTPPNWHFELNHSCDLEQKKTKKGEIGEGNKNKRNIEKWKIRKKHTRISGSKRAFIGEYFAI